MAYNRVNWTNSADTPLNAGNLNIMDLGIKELDNRVSDLQTKTTMLYSNNLSLHNFTGNTLMLNSKGFENTDNYTTIDEPTEFTAINDYLKISTASKSGVYGKLSKTIDLWGDGRQLLVKLRVKASKSGAKIYPVRRLNGSYGTYIDSFCVVSSNLTNVNTMSHWVLSGTNWNDLWLIIKGNTSDGYHLNEIGIFIQSQDNTAITVYVQQFDVFYNNDISEMSGATAEQLQQIESNTASINNINAKLNSGLTKTGYENKKISVFGDSISTFAGWIPETHRARYPQDDLLTDVEKTWWKRLIKNLGATLGINDSWAGTTISNYSETNSGDAGPDACMASMTRIKNLGSNGTPDVIIMYGGTNDIHIDCDNRLGTFDTSLTYTLDTSTRVWENFATAFKDTIMRLQSEYPLAEIIVLLPAFTKSYYTMSTLNKYNSMMKRICNYFGVKYIDLRTCGVNWSNLDYTLGDGIHPNEKGMELIEKCVRKAMLSNQIIEEMEDVKTFTAKISLPVEISAQYPSEIMQGDTFVGCLELIKEGYGILGITIKMGDERIDVAPYCTPKGNKMYINIPNVTGDIYISVLSTDSDADERSSANEHIQEIPLAATALNNLYKAIGPQDGYYNTEGQWIVETPVLPSIVIPVAYHDAIYANSFGEGDWLGSARQGIRVTYLYDNEIVKSMSPAEVYEEYSQQGHLLIPEGVNTVCVPWWSKSEDNVLHILTLNNFTTYG